MPTALRRRLVAPLLVLAGAVLFGLGAGGFGGVDTRLEAAVQVQPRPQPPEQGPPAPGFGGHRDVRGDRPRQHRGEF